MEQYYNYIPFPFAITLTIFFLLLGFLALIPQRKKLDLPPGKYGLPVIGETISFLTSMKKGNIEGFIAARTGGYSFKLFKTSLFGEKMSVICDPSANKFVFSNENKFVRFCLPGSILKILNQGRHESTANEMNFFRMQRGHFAHFLKPDAIQKYIKAVDHMIKQHMDSEWAPNSSIRVFPLAKKLIFSISSSLFMGIKDPALVHTLEHQFEILINGLIAVPLDLPGTAYGRAIKAAKFMGAEIEKMIQSRRQKNQPSQMSSDHDDTNLLSYLLSATNDAGDLLSGSDITKMMLGILIASYDTSSSLLTNLVYYLADHPHVYELALQEQIKIKSSKGDDQLLTWEDTKKMKYGRNLINEVLRISPPGFAAFREVIHDTPFEGYTVPKGWKIFIAFHSTHKNPKYFPEPDKFDPTRFEGDGPAPYSFTPFGGGPRMCQGNELVRQEALVFLHNLLINFKWEKMIANEKIINAPVPVPEHELPIKLQKRSPEAM